jgi:hypothetical protein
LADKWLNVSLDLKRFKIQKEKRENVFLTKLRKETGNALVWLVKH